MPSHDAVAFYLLSKEVVRERKVVQSGQGADEIFAGYSWYPPVAEADGDGFDAYHAAFFDRTHAELNALIEPAFQLGRDVSAEVARVHFTLPGAADPLDRALRLDTEVMLVDDPVKRLDNMSMAWGLEVRTPFLDHQLVELAAACPPALKLADGGKGVLKAAGRRVLPVEVVDRPKGYFPVPALSELRGPTLALAREALTAPAARERGLFRPDRVDWLLDDPGRHRSNVGPSTLWQLAVVELWLQNLGV
jgi:asparagine synthase (glutamine-hydrolysing)